MTSEKPNGEIKSNVPNCRRVWSEGMKLKRFHFDAAYLAKLQQVAKANGITTTAALNEAIAKYVALRPA
ncbi:hypothetical protein [Anatilimnocola aggregata]|nr:hypothetical protein [Anatilimnocola aggregata]